MSMKGEPNASCLSESKEVTLPVTEGSSYPSFTRITPHFFCFEIDIKTTDVRKGNECVKVVKCGLYLGAKQTGCEWWETPGKHLPIEVNLSYVCQ